MCLNFPLLRAKMSREGKLFMQTDGIIKITIQELRSVYVKQKSMCVFVVLHNRTTWCLTNIWHHVCFQGPSDPGQKLIPLTKKKKKQIEWGKRRKRRDKSSLKKDKSNWPKGSKGSSCLHLESKRRRGKWKGSLERNLGESSFFSGTAESLIMGLDSTSAPLGMWKRGLVDDGWMRFSGMMWVGLKRGGVLLVVWDGSGRQHAGGLGHVPRGGWWWERRGKATALGLTWTFASTAIAFHSEQLAHNGHSGARSPSAGHGDPRLPQLTCLGATRMPVFTLPGGDGGMHVKVLQGNIQIEKCSCGGTKGY